jgi:HlyD family secretion protein
VASDGRAQRRHVKVGGRTPSDAWIEEGLAPAERVIVYPSDAVAEGRQVKPVRGPA